MFTPESQIINNNEKKEKKSTIIKGTTTDPKNNLNQSIFEKSDIKMIN